MTHTHTPMRNEMTKAQIEASSPHSKLATAGIILKNLFTLLLILLGLLLVMMSDSLMLN